MSLISDSIANVLAIAQPNTAPASDIVPSVTVAPAPVVALAPGVAPARTEWNTIRDTGFASMPSTWKIWLKKVADGTYQYGGVVADEYYPFGSFLNSEGVWRGGYDLNSTPRVYQQLPDGKWGYVEIVDTPQEGKHLLVNFDGVLLYYYDPGTGQYGTAYSHYAVPLGAYPISKADYDTLLGRGQLSIQADIQKALAITAERDKGTKAVMDTETRVASHAPGLKMAPMELIPNSYLGKTVTQNPDGSFTWDFPATWDADPKWFTLENNPVPTNYWGWLSHKMNGDNLYWAKLVIANPGDFPLVDNIFNRGFPDVYPRLSFARKLRDAILAGRPLPSGATVAQQVVLPSGVSSVVTTPAPTVAPVSVFQTTAKFAPSVSASADPIGADIAGEAVPVVAVVPGVAPGNTIVTVPDYTKTSPPVKSLGVDDPKATPTPIPTIAGAENAVQTTEAPQTAGFDLKSFKTVGPVVGILVLLGLIFGKGKVHA